MTTHYTAFAGDSRIITGALPEVALAVKRMADDPAAPAVIFDDSTGRTVDLDLRGSDDEIVARLSRPATADAAAEGPAARRGRGRPKLGVVAREVTLLPRHWEWLSTQPGGASVALRKLVEEARRTRGDQDRRRMARDAAYHFMSAMGGDLPGFEEASRALFAGDRRFADLILSWPRDIREHAIRLASGAGD
jgi:hypothetical protein